MATYTIVKQDNAVKITNDLGAIIDIKSRAVITGRPATDFHGDYIIIGWNVSGNIPQGLKIFISEIGTIDGSPAAGTLEGILDQLVPLFVSTAGTLTELADFPASFVDAGGFFLRVANDENGVEFFDLNTYLSNTYMLKNRTITINGVTKAVSTNPSFTVSGGGGGGASIVSVTKAEMDALIEADGLTAGQLYEITDAHPALYGGTAVTVLAVTTNSLALEGTGKFYTPKYDNSITGRGIWRNFSTFNPTNVVGIPNWNENVTAYDADASPVGTGTLVGNGSGLVVADGTTGDLVNWTQATYMVGDSSGVVIYFDTFVYHPAQDPSSTQTDAPFYQIGNNVIWGGKYWTNLTGAIGTAVDIFTFDGTNWQVVPFNETDYNVSFDIIHYDYANDRIVYREDKWGNKVAYSAGWYTEGIAMFQWGSGDGYQQGVSNNIVESGAVCVNLNFRGSGYWDNSFANEAIWGGWYNGNDATSMVEWGNSNVSGLSLRNTAYIDKITMNGGSMYGVDVSGYYQGIERTSFYNSYIEASSLKLDQSGINNTLLISTQWYSTDLDQLEYWNNVVMVDTQFKFNRLSQLYIANTNWNTINFNYNASDVYFGIYYVTIDNCSFYNNIFQSSDFGTSASTITNSNINNSKFFNTYINNIAFDNIYIYQNIFNYWNQGSQRLHLTNIDVRYNDITNLDMSSGATMDSYLGSELASRSSLSYNKMMNVTMVNVVLPNEVHIGENGYGNNIINYTINNINTGGNDVLSFTFNFNSVTGWGAFLQGVEFGSTGTQSFLMSGCNTDGISFNDWSIDGIVQIWDVSGRNGSFQSVTAGDASTLYGWRINGSDYSWSGLTNLTIPAGVILVDVEQQTTRQISCTGVDFSLSTIITDGNKHKTLIDDGTGGALPANVKLMYYDATFTPTLVNLDA